MPSPGMWMLPDISQEDAATPGPSSLVWYIETIDTFGDVGQYTSLALDAAGRPHISYYDGSPDRQNLKYAHFDGSFEETASRFGRAESHGGSWLSETVDSARYVGLYTSLALDASDHPHISYCDDTYFNLKYAWGEECVPVGGASIAGPAVLLVGQTELYTATYLPITATQPVIWTWDSGSVGPTAAYSWTVPGTCTITITATNLCGEAKAYIVEVEPVSYIIYLPLVMRNP